MKKLILGLLVFGLTTQFMFSQIVELPEVRLDVNYKYLDATESEEVAISVRMLEEEVANFDLKESNLYDEDFETYKVSFFIPEGKIVAAYDKDGTILHTIEKFENIKLPKSILETLSKQYPNWSIEEDVYKVRYFGKSGTAKKQYKVKLKNRDKTITEKINESGKFL